MFHTIHIHIQIYHMECESRMLPNVSQFQICSFILIRQRALRRGDVLLIIIAKPPCDILSGILLHILSHLPLELLGPIEVRPGGVTVEGIRSVGIGQQLGEERLEYVGEVVQRGPGLVDHIQTHRAGHLVRG